MKNAYIFSLAMRWKINTCLNLLATLFFYPAAYVQLNDPDAVLWVAVYLTPAVLSTLLLFDSDLKSRKWFQTTSIICQAVCWMNLSVSLWHVGNVEQQQKRVASFLVRLLELEEGRELCGSLLVLLWMQNQTKETPILALILISGAVLLWISCYFDTFAFCSLMFCPSVT